MVPLFILISTYISLIAVTKLRIVSLNRSDWFRYSMCIMLIPTGTSHFIMDQSFQGMIPAIIPFKSTIVYITGLVELLLAIGLIFNRTYKISSYGLIVFFIIVFPANINNALHNTTVPGGLEAQIPNYLWIRLVFQPFFILWIILGLRYNK